jgi:hypothetical protein
MLIFLFFVKKTKWKIEYFGFIKYEMEMLVFLFFSKIKLKSAYSVLFKKRKDPGGFH